MDKGNNKHGGDDHGEDTGNVKVVCRFRPVNENERSRFGGDTI